MRGTSLHHSSEELQLSHHSTEELSHHSNEELLILQNSREELQLPHHNSKEVTTITSQK